MHNHDEFEPNFADAERFVLGSLLTGTYHAENILGKLTSDDFYYSLNAEVFDAICALFHKNVSITPEAVIAQLAQTDDSSEFTRKYVLWLAQSAPEAAFAEYCSNLVLYYSAEREENPVNERWNDYDNNFLPFD